MKDENLQHITGIVNAIDINGDKQVLLYGKIYQPGFKDEYMDKPGNKMIFETIHRLIYQVFYSKSEKEALTGAPSIEEISRSVSLLSSANPSNDRFDEGWYIDGIDDFGNITAVKGSLKRRLRAGEFLTDNSLHQPAEKGGHIRLFIPREMQKAEPVFYYMYGETAGEENSNEIVRVYFNLSFEGNCLLIKLLGNSLNSYAVPFIFKCLYHSWLYTRSDSAVLYFDKKFASITFGILKNIYPRVKEYAADDIPLFTLKLGRGISFAETPVRLNESFGTHWSKIIAAGMMNAYEAGLPKEKWMEEVMKHITVAHGYTNLEKLYLNPGSAYPYEFPYYG